MLKRFRFVFPIPGSGKSYDRWQNHAARKAYREIVASDPDRALSPAVRAQIREYARSCFGASYYAPWLETYAAWRGKFVEGCIPDNYFGRYVVPHTTGRLKNSISRSLAGRLFGCELFPDVGYIINGEVYDRNYQCMDTESLSKQIFADHEAVFVKTDGTVQGKGVFKATREDFASRISGLWNATIQYPVEIHEDLDALSPTAAATIRILTIFAGGNPPYAFAAQLRLGRQGDPHIKSESHVRVAIDMETGSLAEFASANGWMRTSRHPDTNDVFLGMTIPHWNRAVATVVECHKRLPQVMYVGWDVGITPSGAPMLFEANVGHTGITFPEAESGPYFAKYGWHQLHVKNS